MKTVAFTADQQAALDRIMEWRAGKPYGDNQSFVVAGHAGTGKSTLIAHLAQAWNAAAVVAFAGKAAHVLRSKGVDAKTIHRLIYIPVKTFGDRVSFQKRANLGDTETIIVDEASQIDHTLRYDLLYYGLPVLFVGDDGQLPPIGTDPRLMASPNVRLETIHRQARESPILRLAHAFREGRPIFHWEDTRHRRLSVIRRGAFEDLVSPDVQAIVGFNTTRHRINKLVRKMRGFNGHVVCPGDRLICLRNNANWQIFNGQQVNVLDVVRESGQTIDLEIETDDGRVLTLPCLRQQFGNQTVEGLWSEEVALMDYAYAITGHKAQGSEWDEVLVLDELWKGWDPRRWRYTCATRAKERLTYCCDCSA